MACLDNVCIIFMPLRKNVREGNETTLMAIKVKEKTNHMAGLDNACVHNVYTIYMSLEKMR